ncbi:MAG: S9 family peptidase [Bacteroidales bacterium]|nr:S9 family peptidase [Bacteroidales bacterium]
MTTKKTLLILGSFMVMAMLTLVSYADTPPLLDRQLFFDDPEISGGQLSPDGTYLSFLRPYNNNRNIWIKEREAAFSEAIPVTDRTDRPVMGYFWSRDGRYLLYVMDEGGDENFNIYALKPSEARSGFIPEARNITDLEGVRAQIYHIARTDHDVIFVGLNDRDPAWHDLYKLRISSGELTLLRENTNRYTSWVFDRDDRLRLASRSTLTGDNELWRLDDDGESIIYEWSMLENAYAAGFHADNQRIYLVSDKGDDRDKRKLFLMDVETLEKSFLEKDPENRVDFGGLWRSDRTGEVIATFYVDDRVRIYFHNEEYERHYNQVKTTLGKDMEVNFSSGTSDERMFMVSVYSDVQPASVYIYDMDNMMLNFQYTPRAYLEPEDMSPMLAISYPSSDGLEIPAYLTMPRGFGETMLPVVVFPHGGPWARDFWGFSTWVQFLANRGYVVLQPNFRGSTGFGKAFLNAGNREWGDLMQDDITWGVKYLIEQGIADPERIGIFGISYGGYATLAGLAFTPELYAAGVSFVGPSNLITLLNSIPPYWEAIRKTFHERIGDPSDPADEARLVRQSPLFAADRIQTPLMVVQGENDPRVLKAESDQIVVALRDRGWPVTYLNAPDEGHGFARPVNNMAFIAAMEQFLALHLGGRYQPDMPEDVARRLEEITVDISTVTLPEELTPEQVSQQLVPVRPLPEGSFRYKISLKAMGIELESRTVIESQNDKVLITEVSRSPMGETKDEMTLEAATLAPLSRSITQAQADIRVDYLPGKAEGNIRIGEQEIPVNISLGGPLFAEGPGRALQLATLPLSNGYETIFRNTDINTMAERLYRLRVRSDKTEEGAEVWQVIITPADGGAGSQTLWIDKGSYLVLLYEQSLPELGGATLEGILVQED